MEVQALAIKQVRTLFLVAVLVLGTGLVLGCTARGGVGETSVSAGGATSQPSSPAGSPVPSSTTPPPSPTPTATSPPLATAAAAPQAPDSIPIYTYRVVQTYPHDRNAFTQGLIYQDGVLYEGTGLKGRSSLRKVALESGEVLQYLALAPEYFGEGITIWEQDLIQLTWKTKKGFVYDKDSFVQQKTFRYPTEGWGLTHDGQRLIMSDGTATLRFWDPETLVEIGRVQVHDDNGPVARLNELEYVQGEVWANIWQTNYIARIDPETGQVTGWIDLSGLLAPEDMNPPVDVLNGIAYDAENDRLFVTGKLWPKLFQIELSLKQYLPYLATDGPPRP